MPGAAPAASYVSRLRPQRFGDADRVVDAMWRVDRCIRSFVYLYFLGFWEPHRRWSKRNFDDHLGLSRGVTSVNALRTEARGRKSRTTTDVASHHHPIGVPKHPTGCEYAVITRLGLERPQQNKFPELLGQRKGEGRWEQAKKLLQPMTCLSLALAFGYQGFIRQTCFAIPITSSP